MRFAMPLTIYAVIALALLAVGFGAGWRVNEWKEGAAKVAAVEKAQALQAAEQRRADDISQRFEAKLAKFRVVQKTFYNEVKNETQQTVYRDCVVPDTGRVLLDRAITSANDAAGQPDRPVPPAAAPAASANDGGTADVGGGRRGTVWGVQWPAWLSRKSGE